MTNDQSRRHFLKSMTLAGFMLPGLGVSAGAGIWQAHKQSRPDQYERWITAQGKTPEQYGMGAISPIQADAINVSSNFRGHGICQHPTQQHKVVMVSRRPGTVGLEVDLLSGGSREFHSPANHHMQGHGAFSADGNLLFTSESDFQSGAGKIIVRDTHNYNVVAEYSSYGIGPHEIKRMPDNTTLAIANGGLLTHPESGRKVLNLDSMRSTLSYIDINSGELISEHQVPEDKASIRHFDIAADGTIAFGMQIQRRAMSDNHLVPLAGVHKPGKDIELLQAPESLTVALNDYMGSVAVDSHNRLAAFTSPRGDLAMFWHLDDLSLQGYHKFHDVCGLALNASGSHFVLSNSAGKLRQINTKTLQEDRDLRLDFPAMAWDNHMMSVRLTS